MPATPSAKSWRHRLRVSVRGLMILVLLFGVGLGWLAHLVRQANVQCEAVAAIKKAGGDVVYDWQNKVVREPRPWPPKWLVDQIGVDYFGNVVEVWLAGPRIQGAEEVLAHIGHLRRLEALWLAPPTMTDAGLAHLDGLNNLKLMNINLSETQITDTGLAHLKGLACIENLTLTGTSVTDASVSELQESLPWTTIVR
jgi:hypothetical protein